MHCDVIAETLPVLRRNRGTHSLFNVGSFFPWHAFQEILIVLQANSLLAGERSLSTDVIQAAEALTRVHKKLG